MEQLNQYDEFTPTASDIRWTENLLFMLNDGGVWGTSWGMYQINKKTKELNLTLPFPYVPQAVIDLNHNRVKIVLQKLGWGCKP